MGNERKQTHLIVNRFQSSPHIHLPEVLSTMNADKPAGGIYSVTGMSLKGLLRALKAEVAQIMSVERFDLSTISSH